jgi:hypothetical protein
MEEYRVRKTALYVSTPRMHLAGCVCVCRRARGAMGLGGGGVGWVVRFRDCPGALFGSSSSSRVAGPVRW